MRQKGQRTERASAGIEVLVLGHLSTVLGVLHHQTVAALGVLEEAGDCPPVILALLPWLVGGKGALGCHRHRRLHAHTVLLFLVPPFCHRHLLPRRCHVAAVS
jgi:hypothetical protein